MTHQIRITRPNILICQIVLKRPKMLKLKFKMF